MMDTRIGIVYLLTIVACKASEEITNTSENGNPFRCENKIASDICLGCSQLSMVIQVSLDTCCSDQNSFMICDACLSDPESCDKLASELEKVAAFENDEDHYVDERDVMDEEDYDYDALLHLFAKVSNSDTDNGNMREKRFGRLFMNNRRRSGRLLFGKRDSPMVLDLEQRYGRGRYFEKGNSGDMEKRYGSLFMNNNKNRWFGKRSGEAEKRYGQLFIGKSRNGWFGKRNGNFNGLGDEGDKINAVPKRYGSLYIGKGDQGDHIIANKRYGRLFMGRRRAGWLG